MATVTAAPGIIGIGWAPSLTMRTFVLAISFAIIN